MCWFLPSTVWTSHNYVYVPSLWSLCSHPSQLSFVFSTLPKLPATAYMYYTILISSPTMPCSLGLRCTSFFDVPPRFQLYSCLNAQEGPSWNSHMVQSLISFKPLLLNVISSERTLITLLLRLLYFSLLHLPLLEVRPYIYKSSFSWLRM